jgi:twitching motility protein PilT
MEIPELLAFGVKNKSSDLHLSAGLPPMIRVHGDIRRINVPVLTHEDVHGMVYDIMNDGSASTTKKTSNATSPSRSPTWRAFASTPSCNSAAPAP